MINADYIFPALELRRRKYIIKQAVECLKPLMFQFDNIAVCGSSGLLIGPSVADRLNKGLILVRKSNGAEKHHSHLRVEGQYDGRYIVLDDFVQYGNTVRYILQQINIVSASAICVGCYFYNPIRCKKKEDNFQNGEELHSLGILDATQKIFSSYPKKKIR